MRMLSSTRGLILVALVLGGAQLTRPVKSQTESIKKVRTGSISGRVTMQGRGKVGIIVALNKQQAGPLAGPVFKGTSDADGYYRITEVPAGFYRVTPIAPDYVIPEINFVAFGSRGKALNLAEGEAVDDVDFSVTKGAVITGKVTYPDGRPVVEERITITPVRTEPDRGVYIAGAGFQTDDRGVYRIFGLAAGQYKVSVGLLAEVALGAIGRGRPVLERVFYPDVSDANDAKIIEVSEGGEAGNIDITVGRSLKGFTAAGIVIDGETNQPLPNVRLGVQRVIGRQRSFVGSGAVSDQKGEFRIENVLSGKYSVAIMPQPNIQVQADPVNFEIADQDVAGITVRTSKGASVTGNVIIEGTTDKAALVRFARLRLQVYVRSEVNSSGAFQQSFVNPDGSFRLAGLQAGTASFSLSSEDYSQPKGFSFARIEQDGVAHSRGLEIKVGEQLSGVKVVFIYATGIVRGSVTIANGPLPAGARIIVRLAKVGEPSQSLRPQEADSRGHFIIEGVPGGSYDLVASVFVPDSRQRPPSTKQAVNMADGAVIEVAMTLDLNPKRDPVPNP